MPRINCSVENCSYNQGKYCCASIINVEGRDANITEDTSCATFLDRMGYSNLESNGVKSSTELDAILCKVNTCAYHHDDHCGLEEIEVSSLSKTAEVYTQTDCLSFERKTY